MTDVRLTATNPEDSSVVPVACNAKGELKLEEIPPFDGNVDGDLTVSGTAMFAGGNLNISSNGFIDIESPFGGAQNAVIIKDNNSDANIVLQSNGSATFAGGTAVITPTNGSFRAISNALDVTTGCGPVAPNDGYGETYPLGVYSNDYTDTKFFVKADGSATFAGDVVVGSRGSRWMIVESGGLAHLIQQTVKDNNYPELRNIPNELTMVEQALGEVMEKLRMVPPAGWEVWDGSSENS